eukprot:GDKI01015454.1.p1 GENE.GDKI01015454.1~~GDKI01015454.1.p1  ORF type:complete len:100 (+),score=28.74 GDKI01015454.1:287-586(+)
MTTHTPFINHAKACTVVCASVFCAYVFVRMFVCQFASRSVRVFCVCVCAHPLGTSYFDTKPCVCLQATCMFACVCVYVCVCLCVCVFACVHMRICTCTL